MMGIMLVCLTVNGAGHWKGGLTFPRAAADRQQSASDSDAWDLLSVIDHPGRVRTHVGTYT